MTAKARTTPQRHFSQMSCRIEVDQPPATTSRAGVLLSGEPNELLLFVVGVGGIDGEVPEFVRAVSDGDTGDVGVVRAEAGMGSASEVEGFPRSFRPMFGRSCRDGVQYCSIYANQLHSEVQDKSYAHQGKPLGTAAAPNSTNGSSLHRHASPHHSSSQIRWSSRQKA